MYILKPEIWLYVLTFILVYLVHFVCLNVQKFATLNLAKVVSSTFLKMIQKQISDFKKDVPASSNDDVCKARFLILSFYTGV
jgi:hypothetical protein